MKRIFFLLSLLFISFAGSAQDEKKLLKDAGDLLALLKSGQYDKIVAQLDTGNSAKLDSARIGSSWRNIQKRTGPFVKVIDTTYDHQPNYDVVYLTSLFGEKKVDVKFVFGRSGKLKGIFYLPTDGPERYKNPPYFKPALFDEIYTEIENGDYNLKCILTIPKLSGSKVPLVILVHGSGPNDKDESVGATKVFRDLAVGLAANGIAVLRYDKRTRSYGAVLARKKAVITPEEETIQDAVVAFKIANDEPRIDASRIYYLGHSLGAFLLPEIVKRAPSTNGMIYFSPQGRKLEDVFLAQADYILRNDTAKQKDRTTVMDSLSKEAAKVKSLKPSNANDPGKIMGMQPAYWVYLNNYNPFALAKEIQKPMLFLHGERDYQITQEDLKLWQTTLNDKPAVTYKTYPQLNHFFIKGNGKSVPAEYSKAGNVEEVVVLDIASWIKTGTLTK